MVDDNARVRFIGALASCPSTMTVVYCDKRSVNAIVEVFMIIVLYVCLLVVIEMSCVWDNRVSND